MVSKKDGKGMTWEPEPETAIRIGWTVSFLAFLIFVVSAIGEYRGWWDFVGELGMLFGSIASALSFIAAVVYAAEKAQVDDVHRAVQENGAKLDDLGPIKRALVDEDGTVRLRRIEDALAGEDGLARGLDAIEIGLDAQTGVLDEQAGLLRAIRDRL